MENGSPNRLYGRWVDTHGGEDFAAMVTAVLDHADRVCQNLDPEQRVAATGVFATTARYEWMIWNTGWTPEDWPI